jgi:DNA-binding NtrC family response regulator
MKHRILIVDDEKNTREGLKWSLEEDDYQVDTAGDGLQALEKLQLQPSDLVVTDLKMPNLDGMELLRKIREEDPSIAVIMLTAHGTIETAVEAMQMGATHYQTKPIDLKELKIKVRLALGNRDLKLENMELKSLVEKRYGFESIIGSSATMERIFDQVRQVAPTRATVLIQGESGTGKELIAAAIHRQSPRSAKPFIPVNCGALTETLLESELFGYEKGAFTHAVKTKPGRFERADGGTLFLDEIGETSPEFQVKLLRVLETLTFERVGGIEQIKVDVRMLAATNRNIEQMVEEGTFREDLFYRLNIVQMKLPPLRERRGDIPLLVDAFITELSELHGKPPISVSPRALEKLQDFDWPGNIRQLRNILEGLIVMARAKELAPRDLPEEIRKSDPQHQSVQMRIGSTLNEVEKEFIRATVAACNGNRARASKILGIGRKTLYRKLEEDDSRKKEQDAG